MEGQEYILKVPLKQMALRKVAINLWNTFLCQSLPTLTPREQTLELLMKKVKEKAPLLGLPSSLREKLMHLITQIGREIRTWRKCHRLLIPSMVAKNVLDKLCWTSQGAVDYRKTAERLIREERVDTISCYKLACLYCIDDDIRRFWEILSDNCKTRYCNENTLLRIRSPGNLITFWSHFLKGSADLLITGNEPQRTLFQHAFESAALSGNKVATEYFFQKLTPLERQVSLVETAQLVVAKRCSYDKSPHDFPEERFCDVLSYLLSQMRVEEQIEVFQGDPSGTLICFLDWPWQELFMDVAEHMWPFLSSVQFKSLLDRLSNDRNIYSYETIFWEFLEQSPSSYRNFFIDQHKRWFFIRFIGPWFESLFWNDSTECIKSYLRGLSSAQRESLIISCIGVKLCRRLIEREEWFLIELFVEECTLSNEAKMNLKDYFMNCYYKEEDDWEKFFQLIDNVDARLSIKRCVEESEREQPASPKKKC